MIKENLCDVDYAVLNRLKMLMVLLESLEDFNTILGIVKEEFENEIYAEIMRRKKRFEKQVRINQIAKKKRRMKKRRRRNPHKYVPFYGQNHN